MRATLKIILALTVVLAPVAAGAETCTLETYASSWMATGTPFSVKCPSGTYSGHLVATPARRFFRRGRLMLVFDQPVSLIPRKPGDEGEIVPGRGRQIANMLIDGGVGVGTKDLTDGLSGAIFKSWYMIPISAVTLAFFSNGGDVLLKPGYEVHVEPRTQMAPDSGHRLQGTP